MSAGALDPFAVHVSRTLARLGLPLSAIQSDLDRMGYQPYRRTVQHAIRGSTHADHPTPPVPRPEGNPWMRGERHHNARFTIPQVQWIRRQEGIRSAGEVARILNCSQSAVRLIWRRDRWAWAWLPEEEAMAQQGRLFEIRTVGGIVRCAVVEPNGARSPLRHRVLHSPTGFAFGYGGSGPADLARSIVAEITGDEKPHPTLYQAVKWRLVATLPPEGGTIREEEVRDVLQLASRWTRNGRDRA